MGKFNILYKNTTDSATLTASSSAGALLPSNLLTLERAAVWRSTSKTATLTLTWVSPVNVGVVALGRLNLTPTATITVSRFTLPGDATPIDSKQVGSDVLPALLTGRLPVNVQCWFNQSAPLRKITIDFNDAANVVNYIEAAYLVCGDYLTLDYGPSYGAALSVEDGNRIDRAESGDLRVSAGTRARSLKLPLDALSNADAERLLALASEGRGRLSFVSGAPFGRPEMSMMAVIDGSHEAGWKSYGFWQSSLTFKEVCAL